MKTLTDIKQEYPQYADVPDAQLADALYNKYYSSIPRADFDAKIGIQKPSAGLLDRLKTQDYSILPGELQGIDEPAVREAKGAMTSGIVAPPVAGLGAIIEKLVAPPPEALTQQDIPALPPQVSPFEEIRNALTYEPKTPLGQTVARDTGELLDILFKPVKMAGEGWGMIGATPLTPPPEALTRQDVEAAPVPFLEPTLASMGEASAIFSAGCIGKIPGRLYRSVTDSAWYRGMTIPERGLVVSSLEDMIGKGYSEGELLRKWNNPQWREEALARRMKGEQVAPGEPIVSGEVYPEEIRMPEGVENKAPLPEPVQKPPQPTEAFLRDALERMSQELRASGEGTVRKEQPPSAKKAEAPLEPVSTSAQAPPLEAEKPPAPLVGEPVKPTEAKSGGSLQTLSGREITAPPIRVDTNRKATIDSQKADIWLRDEAIKEARLKGEDFARRQFEMANPKKMTQAEKEGMHVYLFGEVKDIFELKGGKPTPPPPTPEIVQPGATSGAKQPWDYDIEGKKNEFKDTDRESFGIKAIEKNRNIVQKKLIDVVNLEKEKNVIETELKMREVISLATKSNNILKAFEKEFGSYRQPYDIDQMKRKIVGGMRKNQLDYSNELPVFDDGKGVVKVYRAISSETKGVEGGNKLYPGDFVSTNKEYVKKFGDVIIEDTVPKADLRAVDAERELIYNPRPPEVLKDYPDLAKPKKEVAPKPDLPIRMETLEKSKGKAKGPEGILGYIKKEGGIDFSKDYNLKEVRQSADGKRVQKKGAKSPDEWAQILKDEGYLGFETGDELATMILNGKARNIFTPENQDVMIERTIRKLENEHIENKLADLEERTYGRDKVPELKERLKGDILDEVKAEGNFTPEEEARIASEVEEYFTDLSQLYEKPAKEALAPTKKTVTQETTEIPGTGYKDNFNLVNPKTEVGRLPEESVTKTGKLFEKRGSTGDLSASETVKALRKLTDNIKEAMPHLEALGKRVYWEGYRTAKDWARQMKTHLGDMWDSFKKHLSDVWEKTKQIMKSERGSMGDMLKSAAKDTKDVFSDINKTTDEYLGAISTRLANIDPSLKNTLRKFEYRRGMKVSDRVNTVLPFIEKVSKMPKDDRAAFDIARKNGDPVELRRLVTKYNLGKEYHDLRVMLKDVYTDATGVGYDVGYRSNYHPRVLKDQKGFLEYFYQIEDWPVIENAIREKEGQLQRYLTDDEKAKLINSMLRGYPSGQIKLSTPGQLKERQFTTLWPELNKYYMDSDGALLQYISDVTDAVEARKLFGKGPKGGKVGNLNDTIGGYVLDLVRQGKLKPKDERVLRDILDARFNEVGTRGVFGLYKNISYIDTMGSPISAITQIGDLAWALYKNGLWQTAKAGGKAIIRQSQFKKEDIGIARVAEEFADTSKAAKAVTKVFKWIGLEMIDNIGKEGLINSTYKAAQKKVLTPKGEAELRKELQPIFEGETDQLIQDIRGGNITENVKLYLFNTLADFQPIALSEMPQKYLTGGNGRIFYMLKTFTLKQFDTYRREAFQKIAKPGTRIQGIKNLMWLMGTFVAANVTADIIKDLLLGRKIDMEDKAVDNLLRLVGISKFVTWKAREEGVGSALVRQIAPPFKAADAISKDIDKAIQGRPTGEIIQSFPFLGKLYYWWFGKGAEKTKKKEKQMKNKPKSDLKKKLERALR